MNKHITHCGNVSAKKKMPDWVLKHKKKGIEIERKGNNYYARRI